MEADSVSYLQAALLLVSVKTLTTTQLRDKLASLKSATPIAFTAMTKPEVRRKGVEQVSLNGLEVPVVNPYLDLRKLVRVRGFTGNPFGTAIQHQQVREGQSPTYTAGERVWGEKLVESPALIVKGEKAYLATQVLGTSRPLYMEKSAMGLKLLKTASVTPFLPAPTPGHRQQLEKPVVRRDYSLESIVSIALGGERYKVIHS